MFSAAKARWLLDRLPLGQARAKAGEICIGTIDAFLLSRFGGEAVIEAGNASRTQLFDVVGGRWDDELLVDFRRASGGAAACCRIDWAVSDGARAWRRLPDGVPVGAVMADSHSALFAHGAFAPGPVKATHGTGSSVMGLVDRDAVRDGDAGAPGVCLTLAWQIDAPMLAFEGNIRCAGATLIWAAELLGVDTKELAEPRRDGGGFARRLSRAGFRRPRRALVGRVRDRNVSGFTFGATRAPFARAALDSIAHQIADVVDAVRASGAPVERLLVDGGPTRNDQLMQFEADMVGVPVERTDVAELSALGVAHLAGVSAGLFTMEGLTRLDRGGEAFNLPARLRTGVRERKAWAQAVARARGLSIQ